MHYKKKAISEKSIDMLPNQIGQIDELCDRIQILMEDDNSAL
jgi:hypothetical protein